MKEVAATGVPTQYFQIFNPIHLSYKQQNGDCKTVSSQTDASPQIYLELGKDMKISCNVGSAASTTSSPFVAISTIFDRIAKISTPKNVGDYQSISWPDTTIQNSIVLNIFYTKVGA